MEHPLFPLLLEANAADAAVSWGRSNKEGDGRMLKELLKQKQRD
jgi:hypothetical protein